MRIHFIENTFENSLLLHMLSHLLLSPKSTIRNPYEIGKNQKSPHTKKYAFLRKIILFIALHFGGFPFHQVSSYTLFDKYQLSQLLP